MQTVVRFQLQIWKLAGLWYNLINLLALITIFETNDIDLVIVGKEQVLLGETNVAD